MPPNTSDIADIAHRLGRNTPLSSQPEIAPAYLATFKSQARHVAERYRELVSLVARLSHVTHEIESIFDNFFVVETAIFEIENGMRARDFRKLPFTTVTGRTNTNNHVPRLYFILSELVKETNEVVDKTVLDEFLRSYQEHSPLSIRELYAIPFMLQVVFVEHFGRLVDRAVTLLGEYEDADATYRAIKKNIEKKSPTEFSKITAALASKYPLIPLSFGLHLFQRLSQEGSAFRPVIKWVKLNFEKQGMHVKDLGEIESRLRSENSAIASHIIESLHWLTQARWDVIVQEINVVDAILSRDPEGAYARMSIESKSEYRQIIVRISERAAVHEAEVARIAVRLAVSAASKRLAKDAEKHVGYYLVDDGRIELEKKIGYRLSWRDRLYRFVIANNKYCYFGAALALNLFLTAIAVFFFDHYRPYSEVSTPILFTAVVIIFFLNTEISLNTVNVVITRFLPVKRLPQLDLLKGIGDAERTFVIVPSMFRSVQSIRDLVHKLEVRYLGNMQENMFFALLLDFKDAGHETMPEDTILVQTALSEIAELNHRYPPSTIGAREKFYVLYRKRQWNEREGVYMCWERKRGKLREFNMLLRGQVATTYVNAETIADIPHVSYVITLDEDTELPKDSAAKLVGSISHPLNKPVLSESGDRVIRGYGIIQPRVSVRLATASRSVFSHLFSAVSGIDSYSGAVSDVYQDLFNNGLFFGKGIYSVDAVEETMRGKIPDNLLLSHDMLEGLFVRVGFASSVVIFDGFPNFYHEFMIRLERWIRGDWQIIGWMQRVYRPAGATEATATFSFIDRWKIFDNIRRSLIPPLVVVLIGIGAFSDVPLWHVSVYTVIVFGAPFFAAFANDIFSIKHIPIGIRLRDTRRQTIASLSHIVLRIVFILDQAIVSVFAIVRTTINMVTGRRLLQWKISSDISSASTGALAEYYRVMWLTQLVSIGLATGVYFGAIHDTFLYYWCLVWILSPICGYVISIPRRRMQSLHLRDVRMLRSVAYRTAHYFLDFSRRENNWLVQDHYQENPKTADSSHPVTSPTNIGMLFGSLFSSYEFGFIPLDSYIDRTRKAFVSLGKLERFKGHLYNWYDIGRLESLLPKYISSVDSANFIMALIAVRQGIKTLPDRKLFDASIVRAVTDALYTLGEETARLVKNKAVSRPARKVVKNIYTQISSAYVMVAAAPEFSDVPEMYSFLSKIHELAGRMEKSVIDLKTYTSTNEFDIVYAYTERLIGLIEKHLGFMRYSAPHALLVDASIHSHVFRDEHLLLSYETFVRHIKKISTLSEMASGSVDKAHAIDFKEAIISSNLTAETKRYIVAWHDRVLTDMARAQLRAREFLDDAAYCERECARFIDEPDFAFLYNAERGLFHIGYNVAFEKIDSACYNLLASESNSVSFVSILKNQVASRHWFYLGRKLVQSGRDTALVSWGGSLFEYLTPLIFFSAHTESLLGKTARAAIRTHQKDARRRSSIWGMGESAYYAFDAAKNYQYQVFGSPRLGLKRGLADYLVVAPYASALSLQVVPHTAAKNLARLTAVGAKGNYGYYDAVDYMNEERVRGSKPFPIQTYYAHHQGFTMLAIHNALLENSIQNYFKRDPRVEALDILLEEKMPTTPAARPLSAPPHVFPVSSVGTKDTGAESKRYLSVHSAVPHYALLSNGSYSVGISNAGAGWSRYKGIALTRFRDDPVIEEYGSYIFIHETKTKTLWSPTVRPVNPSGRGQKAVFFENKAEFLSGMGDIVSKLRVVVDPEYPAEARVLTLTNTGTERQSMTVASYAEVSLALQIQDVQHPQYQKLFVSSEFLPEYNALVYSRPHPEDRTRKIYFAHMLVRESFNRSVVKPCVEREQFIGRYGSLAHPVIFNAPPADHVREYTLDPICSLRLDIELKPNESVNLSFVNIAHEDRDTLIDIIKKYRRLRMSMNRVSHAEKESAILTKKLGITQETATVFQELASSVLVGKATIPTGTPPPSGLPYVHSLWRLGISGDYPIVIIAIEDIEDLQMVKYALSCRTYWKYKGVEIDIVILNREPASYIKVLDDEIDFLIRQNRSAAPDNPRNSIYHVKSDLVTKEDKDVLMYVARAVVDTKDGTFKKQVRSIMMRRTPKFPAPLSLVGRLPARLSGISLAPPSKQQQLLFANDWGGFDEEKSEYVMHISSDRMPLAPWANIIANEHFGTVITESGSMNSWSIDSYDNRITVWRNDPLLFKSSEIMYIRDEETGEVWNPTPFPIATREPFTVRHGKGYSVFEHTHAGIAHTFTISVAETDTIKFATLVMKNTTRKKRTLSISAYCEPVMGVSLDHTQDFLSFTRDLTTGALICAQSFKNNLHGRRSFFDLNNGSFVLSTDRHEFIGRRGLYEAPASMGRTSLSNVITHAASACAALQTSIMIDPGEERCITFLIGEAGSDDEIKKMVEKYRTSDTVLASNTITAEREKTSAFWLPLLSRIQIESPDKKLDTMFNDYLLYQTLSARIWAKTGFFQPSGAFGFRDQLQDMTAFIWSDSGRARAFILKAAAHQFVEGDALNWWHDYNTFGARNVLSDHQLWLAFAVAEYVSVTEDEGVLDEMVPYLEGQAVNFTYQRTWTGTPTASKDAGTLYDHCMRALEKSSGLGPHGLPLMGMGDWNDGLSNVGVGGRGESVWVAWFLLHLIGAFLPYMEKRKDTGLVEHYRALASNIEKAIEKIAWDGAWYRRAFLDSGIAIGSRKLKEFKIDSLAQSWAILSGHADPKKASRALQSAMSHLYDGFSMKLIAPSLESLTFDPGYIKDYPPGVRENGAQYNHAALFMAQALFRNGEADAGKKILDLVNPIAHSDSAEKARIYRAEPYAVASDIYTDPSYRGRGGWTWYTGSAGVMYKTILQYMFGFKKEGNSLSFVPSLPSEWTSCTVTYRHYSTSYRIEIKKPTGVALIVKEIHLDDALISEKKISLVDDGKMHEVQVVMTTAL